MRYTVAESLQSMEPFRSTSDMEGYEFDYSERSEWIDIASLYISSFLTSRYCYSVETVVLCRQSDSLFGRPRPTAACTASLTEGR